MKYARLIYGNNTSQLSTAQYVNLGDYFQTFAMDNIYQSMGIDSSQIYSLDRTKIQDYFGEPLLLPMQGWFGYIKGIEMFPLPSQITPAFLGYHCITNKNYSKECINMYKSCEPICCRDERTFQLMKKHGIKAYLTGCFTITLPERKEVPSTPHVFLVDAPTGIEKYIPENLKKNITYITQEIAMNPANTESEENARIEGIARELLKRYKNEATLVVTSRLHCAAPCLGMGIPVVLVRKYFDDRYAWIDKYLPLYTPDKFDQINWYPSKVDLSNIKPQLVDLAVRILQNDKEKEVLMKEVHEFYMDRKRGDIKLPMITKLYFYMHERFPKTADFLREVVLKKFTVATARNKSEI